jgi:hypothetical protein
VLYGAEYETSGSSKPSGLDNLHDKDVPCAVVYLKENKMIIKTKMKL